MFDGAELLSADGSSSTHLQLVCCKCVDTYVTVKKNQNQICWKFTKVCTVKVMAFSGNHGMCVMHIVPFVVVLLVVAV